VGGATGLAADDRDGWLDLLLVTLVEPQLGRGSPCFVYDYPVSQASLARVRAPGADGGAAVAERFELYLEGVELANGFHELADAGEQARRFALDLAERRRHGEAAVPMDDRLLAALNAGLPPCSGVALGLDRLLMLALGADSIDQVLAFPVGRA
jgi:lysyl-tRNA synthetase class 2